MVVGSCYVLWGKSIRWDLCSVRLWMLTDSVNLIRNMCCFLRMVSFIGNPGQRSDNIAEMSVLNQNGNKSTMHNHIRIIFMLFNLPGECGNI